MSKIFSLDSSEVKHLFFTLLSKLARIAIRQVITELFHRQARKVFRKATAEKVFEKIQGIRFWYLQHAACTNFATGKSKCHGFVQNER